MEEEKKKQKKKQEEKPADHRLTRRDLFKAASISALTAFTVTAARCYDDTGLPEEEDSDSDGLTPDNSIPEDPDSDGNVFDVVVIGTGMGGAAAGAVSALNGLKTLILEKNPVPGGSCSYYEKDGFHIDTGAHMFIQANRGPFGALTRRLKMESIDFVQAYNTLEMKGINMDFIFPRDFALRVLSLPVIALQTRINPLQYPQILNLGLNIVFMPESQIKKLDGVSIEEFIKKYTSDNNVRSILTGILGLMQIVPADQASAGEAIWNLQKIFWGMSISYPKGGSSVISETFLQGAENYGAQVLLETGVKKILLKDGRVDSVILDNGDKIKTRAVISTTSVKDTVLRLAGEEYFPDTYVQGVKAIIPSFTAVQVKLALKKKIINAGCLVGGVPIKSGKNIIAEFTQTAFANAAAGIQGEYIPIYAPVPTNFDETLAPPGCQLVTAVALAPPLDVELQDTPESWIDGMMNTLFAMVPELEENIIFYDTWTIKRLAEWTGKSDGSAISTAQTIIQSGSKRPGHRTPVPGLYLAGDCAGPARGVGTELACQSGMDCADLVTQDFAKILLKRARA